jgi:hypothetical protein
MQLFLEHPGIPITQREVALAYSGSDSRPQYIPKLIHQVYHDNTLQQTCISLNQEWKYKVTLFPNHVSRKQTLI